MASEEAAEATMKRLEIFFLQWVRTLDDAPKRLSREDAIISSFFFPEREGREEGENSPR
jgi:hypothetical protein